MHQLQNILNSKWWQHIPDEFLWEKSKLPGMYDIFTLHNLKWSSPLKRLKNCRLPKQILYSHLLEESRKTGRPKFRHKDTIERDLRVTNIHSDNWQYLSENSKYWRQKKKKKNQQDLVIGYDGELVVVVYNIKTDITKNFRFHGLMV